MADEPEPEESLGDWNSRELCPDGACIGIMRDGRCTECGTATSIDPRLKGLLAEDEADQRTEEHQVATATPPAPDDWQDRDLCPDGSCIGVLGADGRCRACGKEKEVTPDS